MRRGWLSENGSAVESNIHATSKNNCERVPKNTFDRWRRYQRSISGGLPRRHRNHFTASGLFVLRFDRWNVYRGNHRARIGARIDCFSNPRVLSIPWTQDIQRQPLRSYSETSAMEKIQQRTL